VYLEYTLFNMISCMGMVILLHSSHFHMILSFTSLHHSRWHPVHNKTPVQGTKFHAMGNRSHDMKSAKSVLAGLKYSLPLQYTGCRPSSTGAPIVTPALLGNDPVICPKTLVCSGTESLSI
jgi:hypothetical protein